ncbi:GNAT family acetyltransferase [Flavobacterium psychrophilum]|uniref:GNAT family N-acetyltransferase n=2 Tax=Flavobacterium psychrophilum TaxID=96345 RepID=A0A076NUL1_FLAPS|nr:GNAT family protein [Flavobacterium psychrophilum]AIG29405.1 GNAT family acetyltransferase [Flavobacterium psychrophilum]AIG31682.1 GNAT family acetyltransferase [Flavobacterium psychrophilum]AIG33836.1 GNAT family acetyltransferase [Flavobacterium psychrophilum]AIG36198.1 GNAT family acetyltransferase [Flavobacterium psychrophilum]AIG38464.1 GNAT family acetyltransferase [Flavobacterium psychrophilum]
MQSLFFPCLKTKRLIFRQITPTDIQNIYKGLSNPKVIKYYGISFDSLEATEEQMIWYRDLEQNETGIWWAICSLDNNVFYGAGGFNNLNKEHKKAEIGFWLLPEFWGQGFMQEAFPLICDYGFNKLDLNRIEGFVDSENTNCKKAVERLNFKFEGTMRDCEIKEGKYLSVAIYSKLKND